jgi:hypothetical protein
MGSGVAHYTQRVQLKGSVLHVHLSSSVLREELMYGRKNNRHAQRSVGWRLYRLDSTILTKTVRDLKNEKPILFRHFHRYLNREWRSHL